MNIFIGDREKNTHKAISLKYIRDSLEDMFYKEHSIKNSNTTVYVVTPFGLYSHEAILSGNLNNEIMECKQIKSFIKALNEGKNNRK